MANFRYKIEAVETADLDAAQQDNPQIRFLSTQEMPTERAARNDARIPHPNQLKSA